MGTAIFPLDGKSLFNKAENPGIAFELPTSIEYLSRPEEGLEKFISNPVDSDVTSPITPIEMVGLATVTTKVGRGPLLSHPVELICETS